MYKGNYTHTTDVAKHETFTAVATVPHACCPRFAESRERPVAVPVAPHGSAMARGGGNRTVDAPAVGSARMRMFWEPLAVCRMVAFCNALCVLGVRLFFVADYLYSA